MHHLNRTSLCGSVALSACPLLGSLHHHPSTERLPSCKRQLCPLTLTPSPHPHFLATTHPFHLSGNFGPLATSYAWSHALSILCEWLTSPSLMSQGPSMLSHVSECPSFLTALRRKELSITRTEARAPDSLCPACPSQPGLPSTLV